jgi:dihydrofolate synthase/folylpolyglutamate synthase
MGDKNRETMVEALQEVAAGFVVTAPKSERATPAGELAELAAATGVPTLIAENSTQAVDMARAEAGPEGSVLVTGSLYLAGEVRSYLAGDSG